MNLLDMIPLPYKLALIALLIVGTYFKGKGDGLEYYYQYKAEVHANQVAILREIERKQAEAEKAVADVSKSWAAALDYSRRNPPVRVLPANCNSGTSAQTTGTGLKPDATAVAGLSSTTVDAAQCEALINAGVRDAAMVLHLQADRAALCKTYGCE